MIRFHYTDKSVNGQTKLCITCSRELTLNDENFFKRKDSKDGYRNDCKECRRKARAKNYEVNKEKELETNRKYRENNKEKIAVRNREYKDENKERIQEYLENTREERKEKSRKRWESNKEYFKEKAREWKVKNAERVKEYKKINLERDREQARKRYKTPEGRKSSITRTNNYRAKKKHLLNDLTVEQWNECLIYFNHSCAYCGKQYESLEQEHFISVSKGGAFTKTNIVTACRSCNASKYNQDFFEWFKRQEYYSIEREKRILSYLGRDKK